MPASTVCSIPRCRKPVRARSWCHMHWKRWRKHGDPMTTLRRANGTASGARYAVHQHGYVMVGTGRGGLVAEHRLVWERHHGPIPPRFQVHHVNGQRDDNRIENLALLHIADHARLHLHPLTPETSPR